jgi:hypothetical protein
MVGSRRRRTGKNRRGNGHNYEIKGITTILGRAGDK